MLLKHPATERRKAGHGNFHIDIVLPGMAVPQALDTGFYALGRFDHARLGPGAFIGMHPHRNDEILSLLRSGTLVHRDGVGGNPVQVTATNLMMMNAGAGIEHEESTPRDPDTPDVRMLQIFIRPEQADEPAQVQFARLPANQPNVWRLVGAPAGAGAPLLIRSRVLVYDVEMPGGAALALPAPRFADSAYWLYVFDGQVRQDPHGHELLTGDSLVVEHESIELSADAGPATLVLFELDKAARFTRAGMFSGNMRRE